MKVGRPLKEVKALLKSKGHVIELEVIDTMLECYEEHLFYKLSRGEDVKIKDIGKISVGIISGSSMLTGQKKVYETIKFKFTPFSELKLLAKEKISKIQKT